MLPCATANAFWIAKNSVSYFSLVHLSSGGGGLSWIDNETTIFLFLICWRLTAQIPAVRLYKSLLCFLGCCQPHRSYIWNWWMTLANIVSALNLCRPVVGSQKSLFFFFLPPPIQPVSRERKEKMIWYSFTILHCDGGPVYGQFQT